MKRKYIFALLLTATTVAVLLAFKNKDTKNSKQLESQLQLKLDSMCTVMKAPGVTMCVILPGNKMINLASGYSDKEVQLKMKPADRMFSGSIGKTYCAAIILKLVEEKKISLDDKVKKYLGSEAWFKRIQNSEDVTIRQLLSHTSGITNHVGTEIFGKSLYKDPDKVWNYVDLLAMIFDMKPLSKAGTAYSYSDSNYFLLGMIIEKVTGEDYYVQLEKRILKAYKLDNTIPSLTRKMPGLIQGYTRPENRYGLPSKVVKDGMYAFNPQGEYTGGGMMSNTPDLSKWAMILYDGKFISKAMVDTMAMSSLSSNPDNPAAMKYGLGVCISRYNNNTLCYGHYGSYPGYRSAMMYDIKRKYPISVQVNYEINMSYLDSCMLAMIPAINKFIDK